MKESLGKIIEGRINIVFLFFLLAFSALISRLFVLQILNHREYLKLASKQHMLVQEIMPERGVIYAQDKNGGIIPLAFNKVYKNLIVSPKDIKDSNAAADVFAKELGISREDFLKKILNKEDQYKIISKKVNQDAVEKIQRRNLSGVFFEEEKKRVYPHDFLGSGFLGFVSKEKDEEAGRYGLELFYEKDLFGKKGLFEGKKDTAGFWIALGKRVVNPPENGADLVLTVDYNIQFKAEEVLKNLQEKWEAASGSILVMNPKDGRILAMASLPSYNPNEFAKEKDFSVFLNPLAESMYELGSVLKPITMASAIEEKLVEPDTTYNDPGVIEIGRLTIRNFDGKSYKTQTMTQVLEKSLNTGAVYVARLLGQKKQEEYLKRFGFGGKTQVDLPGEVVGNMSNLKSGREIDFATASFGQGIAVTPIQLAMAISAIANGGNLVRPRVVEKIIDDSGNEIKKEPVIQRQVISKETSEKLTKMLISAVRSGFENRAGVKGYFVAGKTGTAQIPRKDGPGYSDKVIHTFVGYAPAFDPRFLVLLQLNEPKGNRFAANTLTPAFHDLAEYVLNYYEVQPDEK